MPQREPRHGYREHDHSTEWQECDTCRLRTGAGITTAYDATYYAGDPDRCPRPGCDGRMCLPEPEPSEAATTIAREAIFDSRLRASRPVKLAVADELARRIDAHKAGA